MAGAKAEHAHPNYMGVFYWLLALTIIEVAVPFLVVAQIPKVFLLVSLAIGKATLVALYFMHLRFEVRTLGVIALTPMILCAFLLFMLVPDSAWRHFG
jgi:cytochrome c oxidase subunit 4